MKKYFLILLFTLFCFIPKDVNAAQIQRVFSGNTAQWQQQQGYYYGMPDPQNRMPSGYLIDDTWSHYFPSNGDYYTVRRLDSTNGLIYAVKQVCLFSDVAVNNGKVYTIDLNFAVGSYMRIGSWDTTLYGFEPDSSCASNKGACSMVWNGANAKLTFVPSENTSNYYVCVGSYTNNNKAIAFNSSTLYTQGIEIRSSTITHDDSSVDLSPIVNQQITTNQKLDNVNNNITNVNNNINTTNEKLDSIGDTLASSDVPSSNDISSQFELIDTINDGPISSLINLPLQILNIFRQALTNNSCQTISLGSLYGKPIQLTCWTLNDPKYTPLGAIVTSILVVLLLYRIFMALVAFFDSITSLEDVFDIPYKGKHEGYKPKHGGDS